MLIVLTANSMIAQGFYDKDDASENSLTVAVIGDPQYGFPSGTDPEPSLGNAITTYEDLKTLVYEFLAILGDVIQPNNMFWEYHEKYTIGMATRPLHMINGNASFYLGVDNFTEHTGQTLDPYKVVEQGIRFIFLHTTGVQTHVGAERSNDNHQCAVGEKAMEWLKDELAEDTKSTTVVFFHAPVFNTTYDSTERMRMVESEEMRTLLESYANVKIFANGHVHYPYGATDSKDRGQYMRSGDLLYISVGRPPNTMFFNFEQNKIEIRVRDNKNKKWHDDFGYTYEVETTLKPKGKF